MKNLFAIALIATLAVASSVAARENLQAAFNAVANTEDEAVAAILPASIPASAEEEHAVWKKKKKQKKHHRKHKHGKHEKHEKHEKHKHKKCCIKYVTLTLVPECKYPEPESVFDPMQATPAIAPPAAIPLYNYS